MVIYPFIAIAAWAISAPIIQAGLRKIKTSDERLLALLVSLVTGCVGLSFFVLPSFRFSWSSHAGWIILAGIFTYPVATGFYYYGIKEISAKRVAPINYIKVLLSALGAYIFLGEVLIVSLKIQIAVALIIAGLCLLYLSKEKTQGKGTLPFWVAFVIALFAPIFWAAGEITMKMGIMNIPASQATYLALLSGTGIYAVTLAVIKPKVIASFPKVFQKFRSYQYFVYHGILSMGIGYTMMWFSLKEIGVTRTVLITSIWPLLASILTIPVERIFFKQRIKKKTLLFIGLAAVILFTAQVLTVSK